MFAAPCALIQFGCVVSLHCVKHAVSGIGNGHFEHACNTLFYCFWLPFVAWAACIYPSFEPKFGRSDNCGLTYTSHVGAAACWSLAVPCWAVGWGCPAAAILGWCCHLVGSCPSGQLIVAARRSHGDEQPWEWWQCCKVAVEALAALLIAFEILPCMPGAKYNCHALRACYVCLIIILLLWPGM